MKKKISANLVRVNFLPSLLQIVHRKQALHLRYHYKSIHCDLLRRPLFKNTHIQLGVNYIKQFIFSLLILRTECALEGSFSVRLPEPGHLEENYNHIKT